jgi:hypothetical protein
MRILQTEVDVAASSIGERRDETPRGRQATSESGDSAAGRRGIGL